MTQVAPTHPQRKSALSGMAQRLLQPLTPQRLVILVALLALSVIFLAPIVWLLLTSLKTENEIYAFPIHWLPQQFHWSNFQQAISIFDYGHYLLDSIELSIIYVTLIVLSSALVGFGFARLRGRGKQQLLIVMLSTLMLPQILTAIPTYVLFARIGLVGTYWPWVFWGLASSPFLAFLFRQFFAGIPKELEEAALIDGASYWRIFWQIFLPLSRPVLATAAIISFTFVWGDWFTPSLFLNSDNTTLAVMIQNGYADNTGHGTLTHLLAAGALIYVLPVLALFFGAQRYFIRGIATTGLKG